MQHLETLEDICHLNDHSCNLLMTDCKDAESHELRICLYTMQSSTNKGWCYFPSVGTEIKCNNSLFSVRTDGNLYAYIRYFPSVGTENYS